ncbi:MAG: glycosyltransferase, partial [Selenomonadaceae bacterium]|nr:glycosyltransferase [Selenomonadaceae bacterium]
IGLEHARGEYIFCVDADDFVIDNALETFYDFAEKYYADVVFTSKFFVCDDTPVPESLSEKIWTPALNDDEPTLESDDFAERVKLFVERRPFWTPWVKFLRRDLLVDNRIEFLPLTICEDGIWTFEIICLAKRWLRVSTPLYVHRENQTSICNRTRSPQEELIFWSSPLSTAVEYLDDFMSRFEFFSQHPNYVVLVINILVNEIFLHMSPTLKELSWREAYEIFRREFKKSEGSHAALISYLFVINHIYRNELIK